MVHDGLQYPLRPDAYTSAILPSESGQRPSTMNSMIMAISVLDWATPVIDSMALDERGIYMAQTACKRAPFYRNT